MNYRMLTIDGVDTRWKWDIVESNDDTQEVRIRVVNLDTKEKLYLRDYKKYLPEDIVELAEYIGNRVSNILPTAKSPCTCGSSSQLGVCQWCHDQYSKIYEGDK